ncbi:MAG: DUF58 domain-containing protein [Longimicrobiales bacterium]|nr:DUF58 domain-containing protein [Longimicrobiales bacterium]
MPEWIRARLRAWRRIRFTRRGATLIAGSLAVGFAAINTGNNLLYLLLGAMLGAMAVSGWLSERTLAKLTVERRVPSGGHAGEEIHLHYRISNGKRRLSTYALEVEEVGLPNLTWVPRIAAGETAHATGRATFLTRGVHPLRLLTLATEYPFGLFRKERDLTRPGEIVVWPRTDLPVQVPVGMGGRRPRARVALPSGATGARGEYRGLREYHPGDDRRDIHWKAAARAGTLVVREYEHDASEAMWVSLDVSTPPGPASERAADLTASLLARLMREGDLVALHAGARVVRPGTGPAQLERILDALARIDFGAPDAPPPLPPSRCVRVTAGERRAGWADVIEAHDR